MKGAVPKKESKMRIRAFPVSIFFLIKHHIMIDLNFHPNIISLLTRILFINLVKSNCTHFFEKISLTYRLLMSTKTKSPWQLYNKYKTFDIQILYKKL